MHSDVSGTFVQPFWPTHPHTLPPVDKYTLRGSPPPNSSQRLRKDHVLPCVANWIDRLHCDGLSLITVSAVGFKRLFDLALPCRFVRNIRVAGEDTRRSRQLCCHRSTPLKPTPIISTSASAAAMNGLSCFRSRLLPDRRADSLCSKTPHLRSGVFDELTPGGRRPDRRRRPKAKRGTIHPIRWSQPWQ
jgi:hypothetical protein